MKRFQEPLLTEDNSRFTQLPIKYKELQDAYENHKAMFWTAQEIPYTDDLNDWNSLNENERYFIEHILAFFAGSDGIVLENLITNFCREIKSSEVRNFYSFQCFIENEHGMTYALLIETFVKDPKRKAELFNAIDTIPCVKRKADWALKWLDTSRPFEERVIAFAMVEGVFFSGSFCAIFWLKSRNKMTKALGKSNELISRDEGLHCLGKGTLVSVDNFCSIPIEQLENYNEKVLSYDLDKKGLFYNDKTQFKYQGIKECIELTFEDGRTLKCTPEHRILTNNGWKEAEKIILNKDKIIMTFENPFFEKTTLDLDYEKKWTLKVGDEYTFSTNNMENIQKSCAFARVIGYLLSDGSLSEGEYSWQGTIYMGHQLDVDSIQKDIKLAFGEILEKVAFDTCYTVRIKSKICNSIRQLENMPTGNRILSNGLSLPMFIYSAPRIIVANFLAGLFGGDGCTSSSKKSTSKNNKIDKFTITKTIKFVFSKKDKETGAKYQSDIIKLLSIFNIDSYGYNEYTLPVKKKNIQTYKYIVTINSENIVKFYKNIGFAHCISKHLRLGIASSISELRNKIKHQNESITNIFNEISDYSKVVDNANILKLSGSKKSSYINKNIKCKLDKIREEAIITWQNKNPLYGKVKSTVSIIDSIIGKTHGTVPYLDEKKLLVDWNVYNWFRTEDNEVEDNEKHITKKKNTKTAYPLKRVENYIPTYEMKVIYIKNIGKLDTYDISVKNTQNFSANGIIVHNCDFAILVYKHLMNKVSQERVEEIMREAVEIEEEFICESLPCKLIGMNSILMREYIKYVADRLLIQLGFEKIYNSENPFDFMKAMCLDGKTNFFEAKVTEYFHSSVAKPTDEHSWDMLENF